LFIKVHHPVLAIYRMQFPDCINYSIVSGSPVWKCFFAEHSLMIASSGFKSSFFGADA
jgi:hypothetical protein